MPFLSACTLTTALYHCIWTLEGGRLLIIPMGEAEAAGGGQQLGGGQETMHTLNHLIQWAIFRHCFPTVGWHACLLPAAFFHDLPVSFSLPCHVPSMHLWSAEKQ